MTNVGWISFGSTCLESRSSTSCGHVRPSVGTVEPALASIAARQRLAVAVREDVDPVALADRVAQRHAPPRRREVELAVVADRARRRAPTSCSQARRDVLVVRVGLVELEHRELGVVLERDALVAEVLAELVDALEAADDQPLEVELGRDPQVEVAVERVVVGGERPRQRAAVERLEHRRLDLEEALRRRGSGAPPRSTRARVDEQLARLLVGDQVELAAGGSASRRRSGRGACRAAGAATWRAP